MTANRSSEEMAMRALIDPELRRRWPSARIVHELPLRYSERRIDMAAITESEIVVVEIKSSRDVVDRLEAQLRGFRPVSTRTIVALAPGHNTQLTLRYEQTPSGEAGREQYTPAQEIIRRVGDPAFETWTVDGVVGVIETGFASRWTRLPDSAALLGMLHVEELTAIADRHRIARAKRPVHADLVRDLWRLMTGREVLAATCRALRGRNAFPQHPPSDPPIIERAA